jgi:hypothetical protein
MPGRFWALTHLEFTRLLEGFNWRQELKWQKVYRLWSANLKDPASVSYERFMGREKPGPQTLEEKFEVLKQMIEYDRINGTKTVTE